MDAGPMVVAAQRATQGDLLGLGAMFLGTGVAMFALPQLFDAGVRFRHRLFGRSTDEDRAVRRDRVLRKLLGGSFILAGGAMLLGGLGVL